MTDGLPHRVRAFILEHVDSIELLEILLLLASNPDKGFTPEVVSDDLRTSVSSATARLSNLHRQHLIEQRTDGAYQFNATSQHRAVVSEVDVAYRQRSVRVVSLIYSRPSELVTVFAEAFVLRKKKDGGDG
jgi:hypothetical protein